MAPEPGLPATLPQTAAEAVPAPELVYRQEGAESLPEKQGLATARAHRTVTPEKGVLAPSAQGTAVFPAQGTDGHTETRPGEAKTPEREPPAAVLPEGNRLSAEAVKQEKQETAKATETPKAPEQAPMEQQIREGTAALAAAPSIAPEPSAPRFIAPETATVQTTEREVSTPLSAAAETAMTSATEPGLPAALPQTAAEAVSVPELVYRQEGAEAFREEQRREAVSAQEREVSALRSAAGETAVSATEPGLPAALPQTAAEAVPAPELVYRQEGTEAVREEQRGETVSAQRPETPETGTHAPAEQGTAVSRERETVGQTAQHPGAAAVPGREPAVEPLPGGNRSAAEAVKRETQEAAKAREMPKAPGQAPAEQQTDRKSVV